MYLASELSNENSALYFYTNEKFSCLTFFFWASSSNHCWAALDLAASVEQSFHCLIVQNRQALQSMRSMDYTLEDNMVDGFSFAPHSQVAEEAIPYLYMQEQKHPISVRRRLSRTHAILGRVIPGAFRCRRWKCLSLVSCPATPYSNGDPPTAPRFCCCCQADWRVVVRRVQMTCLDLRRRAFPLVDLYNQ